MSVAEWISGEEGSKKFVCNRFGWEHLIDQYHLRVPRTTEVDLSPET